MFNKILMSVILVAMALVAGCKKNPDFIIDFPEDPEYVGQYLEASDVSRIAYALDTAPTRGRVQWESPTTGYQYSMMIFSSQEDAGVTSRSFTVLAIAASGNAEVLNLSGTSKEERIWNIVATKPASDVGKVGRMSLESTPVPEAHLLSGPVFNGFIVVEE